MPQFKKKLAKVPSECRAEGKDFVNRKGAVPHCRKRRQQNSKAKLLEAAKRAGIKGRSKMTIKQLENTLANHYRA
jgi:hypothetical protein